MLFNSYIFIFIFLPIVLCLYFLLNYRKQYVVAKVVLVLASLFFYSWWNVSYLPLILISMAVNYYTGSTLTKMGLEAVKKRKRVFILGIVFNLALLGYFKYYDFFISNINSLTGSTIDFLHLALPLGISFFTFQQISYLADSYKGETKEYNLLNYSLFVTFFPQLIAGPIVHHKEMMPQFEDIKNKFFKNRNFASGFYLFSLGLFKKTVIADTLAPWANAGFDKTEVLNMMEAWATSLSYTFQLYFDFSGYTDMAIGLGLMFNIVLPINFNSPYKSLSIQDFWRRWHMTLSRFLRDYIYIPLGGNRFGELITYRNLMATFLIGGLWHGAGWTFIFWGFLHGIALVINRFWQNSGKKLNRFLSWSITFFFINITWVFFRAKSWSDALKVLDGMFFGKIVLHEKLSSLLGGLSTYGVEFGAGMQQIGGNLEIGIVLLIVFIIAVTFKNTNELTKSFKPSFFNLVLVCLLFVYSILSILVVKSDFLYFDF